jgi:hypothetical protein
MTHSPFGASTSVLSSDSIVVASSEQVACDLDGEVVILSLRNGAYYGLDPVATRIWALVERPRAVSSVCEVLLAEYEGVSAEQCLSEVLALLTDLQSWGLITVVEPGMG